MNHRLRWPMGVIEGFIKNIRKSLHKWILKQCHAAHETALIIGPKNSFDDLNKKYKLAGIIEPTEIVDPKQTVSL